MWKILENDFENMKVKIECPKCNYQFIADVYSHCWSVTINPSYCVKCNFYPKGM